MRIDNLQRSSIPDINEPNFNRAVSPRRLQVNSKTEQTVATPRKSTAKKHNESTSTIEKKPKPEELTLQPLIVYTDELSPERLQTVKAEFEEREKKRREQAILARLKKSINKRVDGHWAGNQNEIKDNKPLNFTFDLHGSMIKFRKTNLDNMPKMTPVRLTGQEQSGSLRVTKFVRPTLKAFKSESEDLKGKSLDRRLAVSPLSNSSGQH